MKLFLESFFDLVMGAMLGVMVLFKHEKGESFLSFFDTHDNKFCTCLTLLYTCLMILFTVLSYTVISRNQKALEVSKKGMGHWKIFFQDNKVDTKQRGLFTFYFLMRRIITVIVLMYMIEFPYFQSAILLVLSISNYSYIISVKPFPCKCQNRIEMFNETAIYLSFLFKALM